MELGKQFSLCLGGKTFDIGGAYWAVGKVMKYWSIKLEGNAYESLCLVRQQLMLDIRTEKL